MNNEELRNEPKFLYESIFTDEKSKAAAFDKIAEHFYKANFGTMAKTDIETLMFSIFIEQILNNLQAKEGSTANFQAYSDFLLSKELGISQNRVSSLKLKKQLQYPYEFNWQEAFEKVSKNASYEHGKIKIQIPDINLFYEIKNAVEESGGYIELSLTSKLLTISPGYFIDLLVAISPDKDRDIIRAELRNAIRKANQDNEYIDRQPFGRQLVNCGKDIIVEVFGAFISSTVHPINVLGIAKNILELIQ